MNAAPMNRRTLALFFDKLEVDASGCWLWKAALSSSCYGMFMGENAHRVSYRWFVGPLVKPLTVDHICNTPTCVNPAHLQLLTLKDNVRRQRGRFLDRLSECKSGHALPENITVYNKPDGSTYRACRLCKVASRRLAYLKRKAARLEKVAV